jgi:hypothetical protein
MNVETVRMMIDPSAMSGVLAELPTFEDATRGSVELTALWVKPGRHFNTHYVLRDAADRERRVSAFLVEESRATRVLEANRTHTCGDPSDSSCRACGTRVVGGTLLLQVFPGDYRLPTLGRCLDAKRVRRASGDQGLDVRSATVRAYRPGMRCQILYLTRDDRVVYGKVSVERRGAGYGFRTHQKLYGMLAPCGDALEVSRPVAYLDELDLTLVEGLDGMSFHDLVDSGTQPIEEAAAAARALGVFHGIDCVVPDRPYTIRDEEELVREWVAFTRELFPALRPALDVCTRMLTETTLPPSEQRAVLHRDFYDKQILCRSGRPPALIDLDTAAWGDHELDVANFSAHLALRAIQHGRREDYRALDAAFLGAYPMRLEVARLDWYRRAALTRLACNYALRPRWRKIVPRLLESVLEV